MAARVLAGADVTSASALRSGRAAAERLMQDTCTVERPGDITNDVTGEAELVEVYVGRCKVQTYEGYEQNPKAGGATLTVQRYRVDLPASVLVRPGDLVTITAAVADPHLVGKTYRVTAPFNKSYATASRCFVDEVVT